MSEKQLAEMLDLKPPYLNAIASGKKNVTNAMLYRQLKKYRQERPS